MWTQVPENAWSPPSPVIATVTSSARERERRRLPITPSFMKGSSSIHGIFGATSTGSTFESGMTVCSAPTWRATAVAASVSSSTPPVATVYVRRPGACSAMNDARSDESIPPDSEESVRDVPADPRRRGGGEHLGERVDRFLEAALEDGDVVAVPVQVVGDEPAVLEDEPVRRLHDRDAAEHRAALDRRSRSG